MSLLSGMNDMLTNKAALEAAQDMMDFEEDLALEADELIDTMVDGMVGASDFDDEIDEMEDDFEEAEEIEDEIEDENNFTDTVGKSANEAAALTGMSFLSSLVLDNNDPIKTENGSIGSDEATANHKDNFSAEAKDTNDPITTKNGSIGADASANPENNFAKTTADTNDPISTKNGPIGASATPKDPAVESAMFFGELLGEEVAMEGLIQKMKEKGHAVTAKLNEKKSEKRLDKLQTIGVNQDLDNEKVWTLVSEGKHDQAKRMVEAFGKKLESAKAKISNDDPDASTKTKTAERLIKTNSTVLLQIEKDKRVYDNNKKGMDSKAANEAAMSSLRTSVSNIEDSAIETYLSECLDMIEAFETACDPEATEDGSIGQDSSKASFDGNFSDAKKDTNDPIKAEAGSEGQEDSKATFDENFSDGKKDDNDPIKTEDGSIGQDDSTAKDPAIESTVDELEELNSLLLDDFDDIDDDDI